MIRRLKLVPTGTDNTFVRRRGPQLIDEFLAFEANYLGRKPSTLQRHRVTLSAFMSAYDVRRATLADVEAFVSTKRAAESRKAALGDLRQFFKWATKRGHLRNNPTLNAEPITVEKRIPRPLSSDDLTNVLAAARQPRARAAVMLGAHAGLRVFEMAAVRWADIDMSALLMEVRDGKGAKDRTIEFTPNLVESLAPLERRADGRVLGTTGENISKIIQRRFIAAGVLDHHAHDLRATFATELLRRSGGNITLVQQQLGHASPKTTMQYLNWKPSAAAVMALMYSDAA